MYDDQDRLVGFQDRNQTQKRLQNIEDRRTEFRYRTEPEYENYLDSVVDPYRTTSLTADYDLTTGRVKSLADAAVTKQKHNSESHVHPQPFRTVSLSSKHLLQVKIQRHRQQPPLLSR